MPIKTATPEEIRAMKDRLQRRQEERKIDADIDQVIRMVQKPGPSAEAPTASVDVLPALGYLLLAVCGAILWNVASSIYGLLICGLSIMLSASRIREVFYGTVYT